MGDLYMKTVIITGANSGLGFETAECFAMGGWHIIMACRNPDKADAARKELISESGNKEIEVLTLDLSSLQSVRDFVSEIRKRGLSIDALDCNAGIGSQTSSGTMDGFDNVFQSNYLGHFLLTMLLLPLMKNDARIMNVSSEVHNPPAQWPQLTWPGIKVLMYPNEIGRQRYALSKLCNILFTYELDRKLKKAGSKVAVNAINPGLMLTTNLGGPRRMTTEQIKAREAEMSYWVGDVRKSAETVYTVLSDAAYADVSAKYFDRGTVTIPSSELSYNERLAAELWDKSVQVTGLNKENTLFIIS